MIVSHYLKKWRSEQINKKLKKKKKIDEMKIV